MMKASFHLVCVSKYFFGREIIQKTNKYKSLEIVKGIYGGWRRTPKFKAKPSISFVFNRVRIRVVVQEHSAFANACPPQTDTFLFSIIPSYHVQFSSVILR